MHVLPATVSALDPAHPAVTAILVAWTVGIALLAVLGGLYARKRRSGPTSDRDRPFEDGYRGIYWSGEAGGGGYGDGGADHGGGGGHD